MKRLQIIVFFIILLAVVGCCPCKHLTTSTGTRDSLHVEIRHRTIWIPDTVRVQLSAERTEQTVRQDSSHLETSAAVSDARINPDGSLTHSLENKDGEHPVEVDAKIVYRDSIVWRDRTNWEIVEVERELTAWQQFRLWAFWILLAALLIVWRKPIVGWVRRLAGP